MKEDCQTPRILQPGNRLRTLAAVSWQSRVQLLATPWTVACWAPLSLDFLGKNTGVGCHFLLQGKSIPPLLHWQVDSLPLSHEGSRAKKTSLPIKKKEG